jgi:ribosomal protein L37AE/L43A|tara:strand:+ start:185 stop:418 length:234 start_codon:yes stop_codon:yes gene_type:complete
MGKMKEIFMQEMEEKYHGSHEAMIADMARQSCEEFIKDEEHMCPNCMNPALERNETEARCINCGQSFVWVGGALRFK